MPNMAFYWEKIKERHDSMATPPSSAERENLEDNVARFLKDGAVYCSKPFSKLSKSEFSEMKQLLQLTFLGRKATEYAGNHVPERLYRSFERLYTMYSEKQNRQ